MEIQNESESNASLYVPIAWTLDSLRLPMVIGSFAIIWTLV